MANEPSSSANKLIKYMESTLSAIAIMLILGCPSGLYQIDVDDAASCKDGLAYRVVERLDPDTYSEDYLPVEVSVKKTSGSDRSEGLCVLTLGIIPALYDDFETITVTVKTPIGVKSGSGCLHAKRWLGWICLIPYPALGEKRSDNPKLPDSALEEMIKGQLVETLVSQFSKSEYASFVHKVKEDKAREQTRVQKKAGELETLIKGGKYEEVIEACKAEKNPASGAIWTEICDRAFARLKQSVPTMSDAKRLRALFSMVDDIATKDAIVCRLGQLGEWRLIPIF